MRIVGGLENFVKIDINRDWNKWVGRIKFETFVFTNSKSLKIF